MHDAKGRKLKVGDIVLVPAIIKVLYPSDDYCNVGAESLLRRRPDGKLEDIGAINTAVMLRANPGDTNVLPCEVEAPASVLEGQSPPVITPTVGRVVWIRHADHPEGEQPEAGIVAYVHSDRLINVAGFDHNGAPFSKTSVTLVQPGDPMPTDGIYAEWMPYQLGQAKKHTNA